MINLTLWAAIIGGVAVGAEILSFIRKKEKSKNETAEKLKKLKRKELSGLDLIVEEKMQEIFGLDYVKTNETQKVKDIIYGRILADIL